MHIEEVQQEQVRVEVSDRRRMTKSELMGAHTHETSGGANKIHVWKRGDNYLARGRIGGAAFGETLGAEPGASVKLRRLLTELEDGAFARPSERSRRSISAGSVPRLTIRQLAAEFLDSKRKQVGAQTAADYSARLAPILAFAESPANRKRWPLAADIDARFALDAKSFLFSRTTTRNGRAGGRQRPISSRQVVNVLDTLKSMLSWAADPRNNKLPAGWVNPITPAIVGTGPAKDPFRRDPLPIDARIELVKRMDRWQFCTLVPSLLLPMRPDEAAGLLVDDVDFDNRVLLFGVNLGDVNFTKKKLAFRLPFHDALLPILRANVDGRRSGPLLRKRSIRTKTQRPGVASMEDLVTLFEDEVMASKSGNVQTAHDRKILFRRLLRELGGVTEDSINREFKQLLARAGIENGSTLYTLRSSVTTSMSTGAKLAHLELTYLTSHSTNGILNQYTSLDIHGEMTKYFDHIRPVLDAVASKSSELGLQAT